MTDEVGPLRVIPGSHREPVEIARDNLQRPHQAEALVRGTPGDVIVIHNNLLHSATVNVSEIERQFLGVLYSLTCTRPRIDNFDGPNCRALADTARRMRDRRLLRLLGHDEQTNQRQNTGFTVPAEVDWARWLAEDEEFAQGGEVERKAVQTVWEALS